MKKNLKIILLLFCVFASTAIVKAQISIDTANVSSISDFAPAGARMNPVTFSHTVVGNGKVLYVGVSNNITGTQVPLAGGCTNLTRLTTAGTVSQISYGMQTFERYTTNALDPLNSAAVISPDGCTSVEVFRLLNPAPGTNTISVTVTGGGDYLVIGAITAAGVNQSTSTAGALVPARGTVINPSVTVPTATNDVVLDVIAAEFNSGIINVNAASPTQTRQYVGMFPGGTISIGAGSTKPAEVGASTTTMWQLDTAGEWALGGVRLVALTTASPASIGGFVKTSGGRGLPDTLIVAQNLQSGEQFYVQTDQKGSFMIEELETGVSYLVTVFNFKYDFKPNHRIVNLLDPVENLNFSGQIRRRNLTIDEFRRF